MEPWHLADLGGTTRPTLVSRYALAPQEIEAQSLGRVGAVLDHLASWSPEARRIAQRMVYAAGDLSLLSLIRLHPAAVTDGVRALRRGGPVLVDTRSGLMSLDRVRLERLGCEVWCSADVAVTDADGNVPRAVLAMRELADRVPESVVVIGTAPTALLSLLDLIDDGTAPPALVIGTPVGFTAASESKVELAKRGVPYVTIEGTRGGAALGAAALNALLRLATAGEA